MTSIYNLFIINKSGGLIFYKVSLIFISLQIFSFLASNPRVPCRTMDRRDVWIPTTVWGWQVCGIPCMPSRSSSRPSQAAQASISFKLTPLTSTAFSLSLVPSLVKKLIFSKEISCFLWGADKLGCSLSETKIVEVGIFVSFYLICTQVVSSGSLACP